MLKWSISLELRGRTYAFGLDKERKEVTSKEKLAFWLFPIFGFIDDFPLRICSYFVYKLFMWPHKPIIMKLISNLFDFPGRAPFFL